MSAGRSRHCQPPGSPVSAGPGIRPAETCRVTADATSRDRQERDIGSPAPEQHQADINSATQPAADRSSVPAFDTAGPDIAAAVQGAAPNLAVPQDAVPQAVGVQETVAWKNLLVRLPQASQPQSGDPASLRADQPHDRSTVLRAIVQVARCLRVWPRHTFPHPGNDMDLHHLARDPHGNSLIATRYRCECSVDSSVGSDAGRTVHHQGPSHYRPGGRDRGAKTVVSQSFHPRCLRKSSLSAGYGSWSTAAAAVSAAGRTDARPSFWPRRQSTSAPRRAADAGLPALSEMSRPVRICACFRSSVRLRMDFENLCGAVPPVRPPAAAARPLGAPPVPGAAYAAAGIRAHRHARQRRGRLPPRGGLTLVNKGPATTKRETATLSRADRADRARTSAADLPGGGQRSGPATGINQQGPDRGVNTHSVRSAAAPLPEAPG